MCVLVSLFPIITNTLFGSEVGRAGPARPVHACTAPRRWQRLVRLQLPAALPAMITGFKISAGLSVIGAIIADFFFRQGDPGIGRLIDVYRQRLSTEQLLTALFLSSLVGLLLFWAFDLLGTWVSATPPHPFPIPTERFLQGDTHAHTHPAVAVRRPARPSLAVSTSLAALRRHRHPGTDRHQTARLGRHLPGHHRDPDRLVRHPGARRRVPAGGAGRHHRRQEGHLLRPARRHRRHHRGAPRRPVHQLHADSPADVPGQEHLPRLRRHRRRDRRGGEVPDQGGRRAARHQPAGR